jgi:ATP-binding cassette subfamily B protein
MRSRGEAAADGSGKLSAWRMRRALIGNRVGSIAALALASVLSGFAESGILALVAQIAAALVDGTRHVGVAVGPAHLHTTVGVFLLIGVGLAMTRLGLSWVTAYVPARIAADTQRQLRTDLFAAFTVASWDAQARDREGYLQELLTNQIAQASGGSLQATALVVAMTTALVMILSSLVLDVVAALVVLVAAVALFGFLRPLSKLGTRQAHATSKASVGYAAGVSETVRLSADTHVFGVDAAQRHRNSQMVGDVAVPYYKMQLLSRLVPGIYQSLIYLLVVGSLGVLYETNTGRVASLGAVVLLLVRAGTYGQSAQNSYQNLRQALPYIERVENARRDYEASVPDYGAEALSSIREIAFDSVSFEYEPSRPVLSEITFTVEAGEAIGVIGPSGAGKSTLVQILLGLRLPISGRYLVNGLPAEQFARSDWHDRVAYVPQEPRLLHATVADNIRFFRDIPEDMVERAARLAGIHDDIVAWPHGYATIVGPRADAVSGGQQQRICIARALAAQPDVLILDEPTSALDPHSEHLIQESLSSLKRHLTLFVVAHRMSTLTICRRVLVIVKGRLEAFDSLESLQTSSSYYRATSDLLAASPALPARSTEKRS